MLEVASGLSSLRAREQLSLEYNHSLITLLYGSGSSLHFKLLWQSWLLSHFGELLQLTAKNNMQYVVKSNVNP